MTVSVYKAPAGIYLIVSDDNGALHGWQSGITDENSSFLWNDAKDCLNGLDVSSWGKDFYFDSNWCKMFLKDSTNKHIFSISNLSTTIHLRKSFAFDCLVKMAAFVGKSTKKKRPWVCSFLVTTKQNDIEDYEILGVSPEDAAISAHEKFSELQQDSADSRQDR